MLTIPQLLNFPDQTPVDAVQGKIIGVFERRTVNSQYGAKTVQSCTLQDIGGNKVRVTAWEHPDLAPLKGREVIVHSNKGKGVKVKHDSYTVTKDGPDKGQVKSTVGLEVGKMGNFQFVEVYNQTNGIQPPPASPAKADSSPSGAVSQPSHTEVAPQGQNPVESKRTGNATIFGATVGMAINNAVNFLKDSGQDLTEDAVWQVASRLVRVSQRIESGDLHRVNAAPAPAAPQAKDDGNPF